MAKIVGARPEWVTRKQPGCAYPAKSQLWRKSELANSSAFHTMRTIQQVERGVEIGLKTANEHE